MKLDQEGLDLGLELLLCESQFFHWVINYNFLLLTHPWLKITVRVGPVPYSEIPRSQLSTLRLVSSENDLGQESFSKFKAPARPAVMDSC